MTRGYLLSAVAHLALLAAAMLAMPSTLEKQDIEPMEIAIDMSAFAAEMPSEEPLPIVEVTDEPLAIEPVEEPSEPQEKPQEKPQNEPSDLVEAQPPSLPPPPPPPEPLNESVAVADFEAAPAPAPVPNVEPLQAPSFIPPSRPRDLAAAPSETRPLPPAPREVRREPEPQRSEPSVPAETLRRLTQVANNENERSQPKPTPPTPDRTREITRLVISAVRNHVSACWVVPKGIPDIASMSVTVSVKIDRQKQIQDVNPLTDGRYGSDPFYRQFVDSAQRSFLRAGCDSLPLPDDGYDLWNTIEFEFSGANFG